MNEIDLVFTEVSKYKQGRFIDISKYSTGLLGQQMS